MALELGSMGIRCNAVAPGYINTPTNAGVLAGPEAVAAQEKRIAMGRMGTPEEVADVVASRSKINLLCEVRLTCIRER